MGLTAIPRSEQKKAFITALIIVFVDFILSYFQIEFPFFHFEMYRILLAVGALVFYIRLGKFAWPELGLQLRPEPGWCFWIKVSLFTALILFVATLIAPSIFATLGFPPEDYFHTYAPYQFWKRLPITAIFYPLLEEIPYRFVICVAAIGFCGRGKTIFISGALFAALHFIYDNPRPDNFISGFFLAWVFIKSRSLMLPILLHSLGNIGVLLFGLLRFYCSH